MERPGSRVDRLMFRVDSRASAMSYRCPYREKMSSTLPKYMTYRLWFAARLALILLRCWGQVEPATAHLRTSGVSLLSRKKYIPPIPSRIDYELEEPAFYSAVRLHVEYCFCRSSLGHARSKWNLSIPIHPTVPADGLIVARPKSE